MVASMLDMHQRVNPKKETDNESEDNTSMARRIKPFKTKKCLEY